MLRSPEDLGMHLLVCIRIPVSMVPALLCNLVQNSETSIHTFSFVGNPALSGHADTGTKTISALI